MTEVAGVDGEMLLTALYFSRLFFAYRVGLFEARTLTESSSLLDGDKVDSALFALPRYIHAKPGKSIR